MPLVQSLNLANIGVPAAKVSKTRILRSSNYLGCSASLFKSPALKLESLCDVTPSIFPKP